MQYPAAWAFAAVEYGVGSRSKPVAFRISSSVGSSMAAVPGGAKQGRAQKKAAREPRWAGGRGPAKGMPLMHTLLLGRETVRVPNLAGKW